jgi:hypothetical protein
LPEAIAAYQNAPSWIGGKQSITISNSWGFLWLFVL